MNSKHSLCHAPMAGIRSIACLGVLTGHSMFWILRSQPDKLAVYRILDDYHWISALSKMPQIFMESFFVLTGFWAAQGLYDSFMKVPRTEAALFVVRYYWRRFSRIAPSLYSMLALVYLFVLPAMRANLLSDDARRAFIEVDPFNQANCPRLLWATFAFVNNRLPYAGCVSYTWSMAVQMQFYMITPVLLLLCKFSSTRHRECASGIAILAIFASLLHRLYVMQRTRLWELIPIPFYGPYPGDSLARMHYLWSKTYLSLASHAPALSLGVQAYLALSTQSAGLYISRHQNRFLVMTTILMWITIADQRSNIYGPASNASHPAAKVWVLAIGFVLFTGLLQPLLPFMIVLLTCNKFSIGHVSNLARGLSAWWLTSFSELTFDIYLLHPIVIMALWSYHPPSSWFDPTDARPFFIAVLGVFTTSVTAAWLHLRLVNCIKMLILSMLNTMLAKR